MNGGVRQSGLRSDLGDKQKGWELRGSSFLNDHRIAMALLHERRKRGVAAAAAGELNSSPVNSTLCGRHRST